MTEWIDGQMDKWVDGQKLGSSPCTLGLYKKD